MRVVEEETTLTRIKLIYKDDGGDEKIRLENINSVGCVLRGSFQDPP